MPPLGKLPLLKSLKMWYIERFKKLGVKFMGIEESEKKEKGDIEIPLFPNLVSLFLWNYMNGKSGMGLKKKKTVSEDSL